VRGQARGEDAADSEAVGAHLRRLAWSGVYHLDVGVYALNVRELWASGSGLTRLNTRGRLSC
jgi:hypothetical protein